MPYDGFEFVGRYDYADRDAENARPLSTDANWTFYPEADMKVVPRFKEVQKYAVAATAETAQLILNLQALCQVGVSPLRRRPMKTAILTT